MLPFSKFENSIRRASSALMFCLFVVFTAMPAQAKPRVASIHHCMNQYVLALADPEQIASLTYSVQNPWSSYLYEQGRAVVTHYNNRKAEEIIELKPDVVLAGFGGRPTIALLRKAGLQVEQFGTEKSVDDVKQRITAIGKILDQSSRAELLNAQIDAAIQKGKTGISSSTKMPLAALYNDGGYSRGEATLVDDIIQMSGFRNLAAELGYRGGAKISLEQLVLSRPDYMIKNTTGKLARKSKRLASDVMQHPALLRAMPDSQRIIFPTVYWLCGGASTPVAISYLLEEAQKKRQKDY